MCEVYRKGMKEKKAKPKPASLVASEQTKTAWQSTGSQLFLLLYALVKRFFFLLYFHQPKPSLMISVLIL